MRKKPMNNDHLFSLRYFDNCLILSQKTDLNVSGSSVSEELILAYFKELLFPKKTMFNLSKWWQKYTACCNY